MESGTEVQDRQDEEGTVGRCKASAQAGAPEKPYFLAYCL